LSPLLASAKTPVFLDLHPMSLLQI